MRSTKIIKNCSSSLCTCLHHMVILRNRNKITDFLMILAWASPFNAKFYWRKQDVLNTCVMSVSFVHPPRQMRVLNKYKCNYENVIELFKYDYTPSFEGDTMAIYTSYLNFERIISCVYMGCFGVNTPLS